MNDKIINQAIKEISKRRQFAMETYNNHVSEIEAKVPEIAELNAKLSKSSREIIIATFTQNIDFNSKIREIEFANNQIQSQITNLLISNGYDKDYLKVKYQCNCCRDTGFKKDKNGLELNEYCNCLTSLARIISAKQINQSLKIDTFSFDNFNIDRFSPFEPIPSHNTTIYEHMRVTVEVLKNYADAFYVDHSNFKENSPSIIMSGRTGLGKTHLSMAIANVVLDKGFSVVYDTASNLFSKLADEEFNSSNTSKENFETINFTDLLIIDDLGTEMDNKFYKSCLYNILNNRYLSSLPTIINTNLNLKQLEELYDERILSRILSYENILFYGKDIRNENNLESKPLMKEYYQMRNNL